jgi:hypothetical protein
MTTLGSRFAAVTLVAAAVAAMAALTAMWHARAHDERER